jgi:hypothetical protein
VRLVALWLLVSSAAHAAGRRVLLVGSDGALQHAVEVALGPWSLEVIAQAAPVPSGPAEAARFGTAHEAAAVVWTTPDAFVWIFDVESGQAMARRMEAPAPLDASAAAAVALSVKTLLRATTVAPPAERVAVPRVREELRLEAVVGTQVLFGDPKDAELRLGVALAWYPRRLQRWLGLALRIEAGPGISVDRSGFSGRLIDVTLALQPRLRLPLGRRVELEPTLGAGVHVTSLDGGLPPLGLRAHKDRANASLEGGVALDVQLGRGLRLGLVATVAYLFQYQRYLVSHAPVLTLAPVELDVGLRFSAGVW